MLWAAACAAIRSAIETGWAASAYAAIPLVFENERPEIDDEYVVVTIEGTFAEKSVYGGSGKRISTEGGIVFFHVFTAWGSGTARALGAADAMAGILELKVIDDAVRMEGANPPASFGHGDSSVPDAQPGGTYFRCSGSVPFIVIGTR